MYIPQEIESKVPGRSIVFFPCGFTRACYLHTEKENFEEIEVKENTLQVLDPLHYKQGH